MNNLIEGYLQEVRRRLPANVDKDAIIAELRTHLEDRVHERAAVEPGAEGPDREAAILAVLHDFGDPADLALAYDDESPVLRRTSGDVALRLTKDVARGAGRAVAGAGRVLRPVIVTLLIVTGSLVGIALVAGIVLFDDIRDLAERHAPEPVYDHHRHCDFVCAETISESFYVGQGAREVRLGTDVSAEAGSLRVVIRDPTGATRLDRTYGPGDDIRLDHTAEPRTGTWTATLTYTDFTGRASVDAWTLGLS